jgi:hypothetical protein
MIVELDVDRKGRAVLRDFYMAPAAEDLLEDINAGGRKK